MSTTSTGMHETYRQPVSPGPPISLGRARGMPCGQQLLSVPRAHDGTRRAVTPHAASEQEPLAQEGPFCLVVGQVVRLQPRGPCLLVAAHLGEQLATGRVVDVVAIQL